MKLINDLHIAPNRSGGTTPASALALRKYCLEAFSKLLDSTNEHLVILGDLFDQYQISMADLLETYRLVKAWLSKGHRLCLVIGNHDASNDSSKLSSFKFLAQLLMEHPTVQFLEGGAWVDKARKIYCISHVVNQDLFDLELAKVPECNFLLLHCNYDNFFARESDGSLNMSKEQAEACKAKKIIFAHEHNHHEELNGKVFVLGNQFPTSVSDCLSEQDKYSHRLEGETIHRELSWDRSTEYAELDWRAPLETSARFIRFVGRAAPEEAAQAADAIARYRRTSTAFVVSNAVKIDTPEGQIALEVESLESVRSFDVMAALKKFLKPEEYAILENLK